MSREIRADYSQMLMFPPTVEDWVGPEHPARFIRDMVDSLDLGVMGFRVPEHGPGRPPYGADLVLKVWLYGYFHRIRSTRKLEMACREHMGLIWLTGMNVPDHSSLSRFMGSNKKAIAQLFKQSVQVAAKCKLIGMVINAVDGTKIRAASSRERLVSSEGLEKMLEKLDQSIADFMTEVERLEREEMGEYRLPSGMDSALKRKEKIQKALTELQESQQNRVHHCEPEARFMKGRRSVELSYNGQAVADKENGIIVAQDVVTDETDNGRLVPMLDKVKENMGEVAQENLADAGYFSSPQIGMAEERNYEVLVNAPSSETTASRTPANNPYHTAWFTYDEDRNCCICPHGRVLPYRQTKVRGKNGDRIRIYRCREYRTCPHRWECSKRKTGREIEISVHHKAVERQRAKREDRVNKQVLGQRKRIIEPVFAWIKHQLGFDRWTVFGLEKVRAQWALVCTAINMKKLYKCWLSGGLLLTAH
ncbi:MAG: Transposase DDE domain protein [Syntrophorhabdus sp. PtaU1.Bin153]|nr:MAG: Transposase DDE domain protein [Syntrophorhabdus sp. PtaU1.Bin153]